jgi:hypothetical protein
MRYRSKFLFTAGTILAMTVGFASLAKAAPLAGLTAAVPAVQLTSECCASEARPEKAYYYHRYHRHYYHRHYYHRHYYHRRRYY